MLEATVKDWTGQATDSIAVQSSCARVLLTLSLDMEADDLPHINQQLYAKSTSEVSLEATVKGLQGEMRQCTNRVCAHSMWYWLLVPFQNIQCTMYDALEPKVQAWHIFAPKGPSQAQQSQL